MTTYRVAPDVAWVVDDATGAVYGQRLADGTVVTVGGGVNSSYTAAQLTALAAASSLTPYATYVACDSLGQYTASDASTLVPIGMRGVMERRWISKRDEALRAIADVTAGVGGKAWENNTVITAAGTYTGRYFKTTTTLKACRVQTDDPVVFENCIFWSATAPTGTTAGPPMSTGSVGTYTNAAFRNCIFLADYQDNAGAVQQRCDIERPEVVEFTNCTFLGAGVRVFTTATVTSFIFRGNFGYNIDYRQSNGAGGYNGSKSLYSWLQFIAVEGMTGVVIERNEYVGRPYDTTNTADYGVCEDVFNFSQSGGTSGSHVKVRHNVFYGNYSVIGLPTSTHASSACVQIEAQSSTTPSSWIDVEYNRAIACVNGFALNTCHDCTATNNQVMCSGYVQGASTGSIWSDGYGLVSGNYYSATGAYIYNRTYANNVVGHARRAGTENHAGAGMGNYYHNESMGEDAPVYTDNTELVIGDCTQAAEEAMYQEWLDECIAVGVEVGFRA